VSALSATPIPSPFRRLAGDCGDHVEVSIVVQHRQALDVGGRRHHQIRYPKPSMLPPRYQRGLDLARPVLCPVRHADRDQQTDDILACALEVLRRSRRESHLQLRYEADGNAPSCDSRDEGIGERRHVRP